jgi:predicted Zn-dependent protease
MNNKIKFLLLALISVAACSTNEITGRKQFNLVSESEIIQASSQAYTSQMADYRKKNKLEDDPKVITRVKNITDRLIKQAEKMRPETNSWNWQVTVIDEPEVNAFAMAGGKIAVYTGLINKINPSDDELAEVLGHEISHAIVGHSREQASIAMGTDLALATAAALAGIGERNQTLLAGAALVAVQLPHSRQMESEADRVGMEIAARAGYNPNAAVSLWNKMGQLNKGGGTPQFLSTHPSDQSRMEALEKLVPQMMPIYQAARK